MLSLRSAMFPSSMLLPEKWTIQPLEGCLGETALCLGVVMATETSAAPFVRLRTLPQASVYLACLVDRGKRVHEWLEVWVQHFTSPREGERAVSNAESDHEWAALFRVFEEMDGARLLRTGWENAPPPARTDADGRSADVLAWQLCVDDELLRKQGLPTYSASPHRYLHKVGNAEEPFIPLTREAPSDPRGESPFATVLRGLVLFNPQWGRLITRRYAPFDLGQFSRLITTASIRELSMESELVEAVCGGARVASEEEVRFGDGFYLLSRRGSGGLFVESLYLKLNLLHQILAHAESMTQSLRRPLLGLRTRGLGVELTPTAGMLPSAWTAQVVVRDPGVAASRFLELPDASYFTLDEPSVDSVYQPRSIRRTAHGEGTVRLRRVDNHGGGELWIEGTLATSETLIDGGLLLLHLDLPSGRVVLRARLSSGAAAGEYRFASLVTLDEAHCRHLADASRLAPFPNCAFRALPSLSSACDLYAIAVIAIELLLVDSEQPLGVALDEMIALGNHLNALPPEEDMVAAVGKAVKEQAGGAWRGALGPQRLVQDLTGRPFSHEEALAYVSPEIWWRTIYLALRLLTNGWRFNYCKSDDDAPSLAQHSVYRSPRAHLEVALDELRSLLLLDWDLNQEVRELIEASAAPGR